MVFKEEIMELADLQRAVEELSQSLNDVDKQGVNSDETNEHIYSQIEVTKQIVNQLEIKLHGVPHTNIDMPKVTPWESIHDDTLSSRSYTTHSTVTEPAVSARHNQGHSSAREACPKENAEVSLQKAEKEIDTLTDENRRLQMDCEEARGNVTHLISQFQKRAAQAEKKFQEMHQELKTSQDLAKRYHRLYMETKQAHEKLKQQHEQKQATQKSHTFGNTGLKVNEMLRKNEYLGQENTELNREILRLREENADLLKKAKHAMADQGALLVTLQTNENSKQDLLRSLQNERQKFQKLNRSLTRQATDWVNTKRYLHQMEEDYRWGQVTPLPASIEKRPPTQPGAKDVYIPKKAQHF